MKMIKSNIFIFHIDIILFILSGTAAACAHGGARVHAVGDRKAVPASETTTAQTCVSHASVIRVEAFISATPRWAASLSVRSVLAALDLHGIPTCTRKLLTIFHIDV